MKKTVIRFSPSERWFHNTVMFTFVFLLITGLVMVLHNLLGMRNESREFLSISHRLMSVVFIVGPVTAFLLGNKKVWRENFKILTTWGREDTQWVRNIPFKAIRKGIDLPPEDKFNPGQKIWAGIAITGSVTLVVSGVVIWIFDSAILFIFIHTLFTVLMAMFLSGHVYMALINPDTRPGIGSIIDGEVDADWAMRHHPKWMERRARERVMEKVSAMEAQEVDASAGGDDEGMGGSAG
ncbi:MAG: cytochrome b/b6 domain-containing protein [Nitrospinae bacterium]|nr:cytochrome b/b6 domain-containing protein [Nitrospinota bacterium]